MLPTSLQRLALRCGITPSFLDARGRRRRTSPGTTIALLRAMGHDAGDGRRAGRILADIEEREWRQALPPVLVHARRGPAAVALSLPAAVRRVRMQVLLEGGGRLRRQVEVRQLPVLARQRVGGAAHVRVRLTLPGDLPHGYHTLSIDPGAARMPLIVAPAKCWVAPEILLGSRLWGITSQLYLMRSGRNWGIGDFTDLRALADLAKPLGADVLGLNPLHALFTDDPEQASPYSPASRLLLNVLYIDVAALAQRLENADARRRIEAPEFRVRLARCRRARQVRYGAVAALKLPLLEELFAAASAQRGSRAWRDYERFARGSSAAVRRACLFLALRERFSRKGRELCDWRRWPPEFRDPNSPSVARFAAEHADRVTFQLWLQHAADEQLRAAADAAAPMAIGLYRDLAVGSDAAAAETWANQGCVVAAAHVGAPPDIYNPAGQDWGLPPFSPEGLRAEGYRSFIDLVRANMRHAGGLRIDHVMGLMHLYWVPEGMPPGAGAYVDYPVDDLVGILALESHRHRCMVMGEDLGTVPEGFRERMAAANILSYRVLLFERDERGFLPPDRYPDLALAVTGSHDLPTLRSWWRGGDLALRSRLGLFPTREDERTARRERQRDRTQLQQALADQGLGAELDADAGFMAAHAFLARSPCAIATAQLDDITDEPEPVNVPTSGSSYPNWRRRLSLTLEQIARSRRLAKLARVMNHERSCRREPARGALTPGRRSISRAR